VRSGFGHAAPVHSRMEQPKVAEFDPVECAIVDIHVPVPYHDP
jgi:hypothetical protein